MKLSKLFIFLLMAVFLCSTVAMADNITISDDRYDGTSHNGNYEDQEVEPGMVWDQSWDLERFLLNGSQLAMVGGFDFKNGKLYNNHQYDSGDIFISTGDAPFFGDAATNASSIPFANGYEYVFDVNWATGNYSVYAVDTSSSLDAPFSYNDPESSPWNFNYTDEALISTGSFVYQSGLSDGQASNYDSTSGNLFGGLHYIVSGFDLSFLPAETDFYAHFTMECGNDNLMGMGTTPVPEPATMLLLGVGLIGLGGIGRKRFTHNA